MKRLLNMKNVRNFILVRLGEMRPHLGLYRVSGRALNAYENLLRYAIEADIRRHPTIGKTFDPRR